MPKPAPQNTLWYS